MASDSAAWRNRLPRNHAAGIACNEHHGTGVACAVEVSIENKRPRIHRATVALDCGLAVNPLSVEAQFQGGIGFGLVQLMAGRRVPGACDRAGGRQRSRPADRKALSSVAADNRLA